ncbi:MAG: UvrD-helicase domain-containing protein [Nanoarchaeota archaeon]
MSTERDYLGILNALDEIPFPVGKKLLIDVLLGESKNQSIVKNRLFRLKSFGSIAYSASELSDLIESLITNRLIEYVRLAGFQKVLVLTAKGNEELKSPSHKDISVQAARFQTRITNDDKRLFAEFSFFLSQYTDEQKKAIVCPKEKIVCIAGAGSGKTEVLTKRIEFLVKFRGLDPTKILAITFTRKARQEMMARVSFPVHIETFNSFCEGILNKYNNIAYDRPVRVIAYKDKIRLLRSVLAEEHIAMGKALETYFTKRQMQGKLQEELARIFLNDCFYFRSRMHERKIPNMSNAEFDLIRLVAEGIDNRMKEEGLRDFDDQIKDSISLFKRIPTLVPKFDHVLVDEFQDINAQQEELLSLLKPKNVFCVGDPRQSIFGWRGSKIEFVLTFHEKNPDAEIVSLTKNFRSKKPIVTLINAAIRGMQLPDLEPVHDGKRGIFMLSFENEQGEYEFVLQRILEEKVAKKEIFVLARTNKQLVELAERFAVHGIPCLIRSEELKRSKAEDADAVTIATIHAIKGMQAKTVFVVGITPQNFPCRGSDHPIIDLIREEYDREEEERRLLYVALSRAKESLYISYSGKSHSRFLSDEMKKILEAK